MSTPTAPATPANHDVPMKRVVAVSLSGAFMEWYDFNLYTLSAALIFNKIFFADLGPGVGTVVALGTVAAAYVTRPIGAIIFGHLGDRVGRRGSLIATMALIGGGTFVVGLLPTYEDIGAWAPILLIVMRLIQGLGLGGEFGGASLMAMEYSPRHQRGRWTSLMQIGGPIGFLIATGFLALLPATMGDQFLEWGWRIPFLISILMLVVGLVLRLKISETPAFRQLEQHSSRPRVPLWEALRKYPKNIVLGFGFRFSEASIAHLFQSFAVAYLTGTLALSDGITFTGTSIYQALTIILIPTAGILSDRFGRRPVAITGAVILAVLAFPYFALINTGVPGLIWFGMAVVAFGTSCMQGLEPSILTESFGARVRYSASSVSYQFSALASSFIPAAAFAIILATGSAMWVALLALVLALVGIASVYALRETSWRDADELERDSASERAGLLS